MRMSIIIKKKRLMEFMIEISFMLLPFTLFLNTFLFNGVKLMGMGVINIFIDITFLLALIDSNLRKKNYKDNFHIFYFFILLLIVTLIKVSISNSNFSAWFIAKQYYFLVPLVYISLCNKRIDIQKIIRVLCLETVIICPLSIYMFLTKNYFGSVMNEDLLKYDIVGTPFARMFSIFGSPLVAGPFFSLISMILIMQLKDKKIGTKVLLALNCICLVLTFSRAALIALIVFCFVKFVSEKEMSSFKKTISTLMLVIIVIGTIIITSDKGAYFWKGDIFDNVRIGKWLSNISGIFKHWFLGYDFALQISSTGTWESTLSDNSILIALADFGILFWGIISLLELVRYCKKNEYDKRYFRPLILAIFVMMILYDFVQVFPCNYIAILIYVYMKRNICNYNAKEGKVR